MTNSNLYKILQFNKYKNDMVGKRVDWDSQYKYQCVDLIRDYAHKNNYPKITNYGNAIDLWNKGLGDGYKRIYNTKFATPSVGDIILFDVGRYGHIAIAGRGNPMWIEILEQNAGNGDGNGLGDNAIRVKRNFYKNCVGWFTPIL